MAKKEPAFERVQAKGSSDKGVKTNPKAPKGAPKGGSGPKKPKGGKC